LLSKAVKALFKPLPEKLTLIITIGNPFRSDDGVGPYLASRLKPCRNLKVLDVADQPENFILDAIAFKPARIIIIDAANFGGKPGAARLIKPHALSDKFFSTHALPLSAMAKIIKAETKAVVYILGIQAQSLEYKEGLSPSVQATADELVELLMPESLY
jgi:hydrogenase 3 maturation protease